MKPIAFRLLKAGQYFRPCAAFALASLLATSVTAQLVSFTFAEDLDVDFMAPQVQSATMDFTLIDYAAVADDGFGNVLQAFPAVNSTSGGQAILIGSYFTFSVVAQAGQTLDLGSLTVEAGKGGTSDPRGVIVRSSADGFSTSLLTLDPLPLGAATAPASYSIDLSGALYQEISSIAFRFYIYSPFPEGNSVDFRNLMLTAAVPEPETLALWAGLAALGLALMRHRMRRG